MIKEDVALRAKYRVQNALYKIRYGLYEKVTLEEVKIAEEFNEEIIKAYHEGKYDVVLKKVKGANRFIQNLSERLNQK